MPGASEVQKRILVPKELELQMVVSWHVGAETQTWVAGTASALTTDLSLQPLLSVLLR